MQARALSSIVFLAAAFAFAAQASALIIQDDVFSPADWTTSELIDTSTNDSGLFTGQQSAMGGNPGPYWRVINEVNEAGPIAINLMGGHLYGAASYDPSLSGAVNTVQITFDGLGVSGPSGAMGFRALVEQGGLFYVASVPQVLNGLGWQARDSGALAASGFARVIGGIEDPALNPDFSATGGVLRFGVATANGTFGTPSTNEGGFDNWVATISSVPEAGVAWLLAFGAAALAGRRRNLV